MSLSLFFRRIFRRRPPSAPDRREPPLPLMSHVVAEPSAVAIGTAKYCQSCGAENRREARFCGACGHGMRLPGEAGLLLAHGDHWHCPYGRKPSNFCTKCGERL